MNHSDINESLIGKTVTWTSQSSGTVKEKTGTVVSLVGAEAFISRVIKNNPDLAQYRTRLSMQNPGGPRKHVSVLVAVGRDLYWPVVAKLEVVE